MINILYGFLTFCAGFVIDTAYIYSIHFSERNKPAHTAICTIIMGDLVLVFILR